MTENVHFLPKLVEFCGRSLLLFWAQNNAKPQVLSYKLFLQQLRFYSTLNNKRTHLYCNCSSDLRHLP